MMMTWTSVGRDTRAEAGLGGPVRGPVGVDMVVE